MLRVLAGLLFCPRRGDDQGDSRERSGDEGEYGSLGLRVHNNPPCSEYGWLSLNIQQAVCLAASNEKCGITQVCDDCIALCRTGVWIGKKTASFVQMCPADPPAGAEKACPQDPWLPPLSQKVTMWKPAGLPAFPST